MRYPDSSGLSAPQRDQQEQVRFQAAEVFAQGMRPPQVAERLRVSQKSARAWHAQWRAGGIEALRSKGPSSRPSRFRPQGRPEPAALPEQGPTAHGWVEDQRRTPARVATVIGRRRHVWLSVPQTWRLLRQMGFTAQVPVHRAAERDEQAVATWVKVGVPRLRGSLAGGGTTVREQGAWLCFPDESGLVLTL
ncbi:hypothetical protein DIZ27_43680 [Streptomyces sp. NWU339]|uniref:winged helix-turn-helix domain-containing protein n=1 Tax=Streptomyces sp. NWU339 TaxID=2185284 RepID=UPI000D6820F8|nr:winged helix-turn-helix domain-containing protein [Streptomyces sp. NWU339]PWI04705.1 hypothetical protein DIZ27_43680 [Streptomyces sp. NWU339]